MPLPVSGPISFNDINVELFVAGTTQASLNQASYRALAGVPSGTISMSDFYGKSNSFLFTIGSNQINPNLRTLAVNAGWNGTLRVVATIGSGIYCGSNLTTTPGLTINGSFPNGVELINNGIIVGRGGNGGNGGGGPSNPGGNGSAGGLALSAQVAVTITNNGTIAGGGGGGGGGQGSTSGPPKYRTNETGGGGGGGRSSQAANSLGGSPGGGQGTVSAAGNGGTQGVDGGAGGGWGASGANQQGTSGGIGGAGGAAVSGNGNITWLAFGTRLGAIT